MSEHLNDEIYSETLGETLTRHNTALFTFIGESAIGPHRVYDHVFISGENEEGEAEFYAYIFNDHKDYETLFEHIKLYRWPQHLNLTEVSEMDQRAFDMTHGISDEDTVFPSDWNNYPQLEAGDDLPPDPNHYDLDGDEGKGTE